MRLHVCASEFLEPAGSRVELASGAWHIIYIYIYVYTHIYIYMYMFYLMVLLLLLLLSLLLLLLLTYGHSPRRVSSLELTCMGISGMSIR